MIEILENYLAAAKENLARYIEMGDERAIVAGEGMVSDFERLIEEAKNNG